MEFDIYDHSFKICTAHIYNGFYRTGTGKEQQFVRLERDQLATPTDPSRKPLNHRQDITTFRWTIID